MYTKTEAFENVISQLITQGYAFTRELFNDSLLTGLLENLERKENEKELQRAGIGSRYNKVVDIEIRSDEVSWIDNQTTDVYETDFLNIIDDFSTYMNRTCFTGIRSREFHYACFHPGAFFKKHYDVFKDNDARKFSVVTYLNKDWEASCSGEIVLYKENTVKILPEWGTTVIFESRLVEHEVLPTNKTRYSVTGWLKTF